MVCLLAAIITRFSRFETFSQNMSKKPIWLQTVGNGDELDKMGLLKIYIRITKHKQSVLRGEIQMNSKHSDVSWDDYS